MFSCGGCSKCFTSESSLAQHELAKGHFACLVCSKTFGSSRAKEQHWDAVHKPNWKCADCGATFWSDDNLQEHIDEEHPIYECDFCTKNFKSALALQNHTNAVHRFECDQCGKVFGRARSLDQHIKDAHNDRDDETSDGGSSDGSSVDDVYGDMFDTEHPFFGKFHCGKCTKYAFHGRKEKKWRSAYVWALSYGIYYTQQCIRCKRQVHPYKVRQLKSGLGSQKDHETDLCAKCDELGYNCKFYPKNR
eukprot:Phypoly_transcript_12538.p1 GENE.Phypoly_transcript_12538~~Phypoly_transcript_12538.p1  ORF type:complete len:248 (+),score=18.39 Phypoly_transcript_12538:32-775(+)